MPGILEINRHIENLRAISIGKPCADISTVAINTQIKVLEVRDPYTNKHQLGVAKISDIIAKHLSLDENQRSLIFISSLLHDIGKIAMPHDILSKPKKLSKAEYLLLQEHTTIGRDLLSDFDKFFPKLSTIVAQHHEKIDGSGYPHGLLKNDILIESRIIVVADVVEAMASHRPYRPALGLDVAIAEIKRGSGSIYDKEASEVLTCLYDSGKLEI